jgi:catechol 2,3-dioxygenase-like lactoylglutathione lyase family enzyme
MLQSQKLIAFLATNDAERARSFYRDTVGLTLKSEDPLALVFDAGGTMLRVTIVPQVAAAPYTVLGWQVSDVRAMARRLREAGITPERYPGINQDADGVWTSPGGAQILWFKDPAGHTLSLTQEATRSA